MILLANAKALLANFILVTHVSEADPAGVFPPFLELNYDDSAFVFDGAKR